MQESLSIPNGLFCLKDRSIISLKGEGSDEFLQGLITQDIKKLESESALYGFFLNQLGRYVMDVFISKVDSVYYLDVPTDLVRTWVQKLNMYKLRRPLTIEWQEGLCVIATSNLNNLEQSTVCAFKDPRCDFIGFRCVLSRNSEKPFLEASEGVDFGGYYQALTDVGIPRHGFELISDRTIPLEANLDYLNGVSFDKGCYVGQELTSRTHHLGQIRKRYLPFRWDTSVPLDALKLGDEIFYKGESVGSITSLTSSGGMARIALDAIKSSMQENEPIHTGDRLLRFINPGFMAPSFF